MAPSSITLRSSFAKSANNNTPAIFKRIMYSTNSCLYKNLQRTISFWRELVKRLTTCPLFKIFQLRGSSWGEAMTAKLESLTFQYLEIMPKYRRREANIGSSITNLSSGL